MSESYRRRAFRTRLEHQFLIVEACEKEPALLHVNPSNKMSKNLHHENWEILTRKLNELGFGDKTTDKWQRVVTDWVSKVKSKVVKIKEFVSATGCKPPIGLSLSDLEVRILTLKGYDCSVLEGVEIEKKIPEIQRKNSLNKNLMYKNVFILPKLPIANIEEFPINDNSGILPTLSPNPLNIKEEIFYQDVDSLDIDNNVDNESNEYEDDNSYLYEAEPPLKKIKLLDRKNAMENGSYSVQEETLKTLKSINDNISRLTNAVERLADKLSK